MTSNSLTENEEHDIPWHILKTIFGLYAWLCLKLKYVWFPVHLLCPAIPDPIGQLAELIFYVTSTRVDLWEGSKAASLVCVGLLCLASFGTVLPSRIPQKLLWAIALWSGLRWTNIQSWTLFMCSFPVILMFYINFAGEP